MKELYLLGQTTIDIKTGEIKAFIKVGATTNFFNRIKMYECHNPQFIIIARKEVRKNLFIREKILNESFENSIYGLISNKKTEWHEVSIDTYKEILEKGFKYFKVK